VPFTVWARNPGDDGKHPASGGIGKSRIISGMDADPSCGDPESVDEEWHSCMLLDRDEGGEA